MAALLLEIKKSKKSSMATALQLTVPIILTFVLLCPKWMSLTVTNAAPPTVVFQLILKESISPRVDLIENGGITLENGWKMRSPQEVQESPIDLFQAVQESISPMIIVQESSSPTVLFQSLLTNLSIFFVFSEKWRYRVRNTTLDASIDRAHGLQVILELEPPAATKAPVSVMKMEESSSSSTSLSRKLQILIMISKKQYSISMDSTDTIAGLKEKSSISDRAPILLPDRLLMNVALVSIACKAREGLQGFVAPLSLINNESMVTSPSFAQEGVAMGSMAEPTDSSLLENYFDRFYAGGFDEGVGPQSRLQFRSAVGSAEGKVLPTLATAHKLFDCEISLYTIFSLAAFCTESMATLVSMADIEAKAMELGIDLSTVDFGNIIVVDNLPVVPPEKFETLEGVIRKIYSQIEMIKDDGLWMPINSESKKTLGYCFIEFNTPQEAELAKERTHGYKLDKAHIFAVNLFNDFDKFMKVPDEWALPEIKPYTPGENLQQWLTDEKVRDQFVIRAGSDTEVLWNDPRQLKPELVYRRGYWTESFVHRLRNHWFSGTDSADSPFQIWRAAQLECA